MKKTKIFLFSAAVLAGVSFGMSNVNADTVSTTPETTVSQTVQGSDAPSNSAAQDNQSAANSVANEQFAGADVQSAAPQLVQVRFKQQKVLQI